MCALRLENGVLRSFDETSRDALLCIEFLEPVDLSAPKPYDWKPFLLRLEFDARRYLQFL